MKARARSLRLRLWTLRPAHSRRVLLRPPRSNPMDAAFKLPIHFGGGPHWTKPIRFT
jgi:hypothetical protein